MEIGELTATKRTDLETTKHFLSKCEDEYRAAYARRSISHKRQCVFWGTTNDMQFLKDKSGNRRFLPVEVGINKPRTHVWDIKQVDINQIWAEAKYYYDNNFSIYMNEEERTLINNYQQLHTDISPLEGIIKEYLEIPITKDWYKLPIYERRNYIANYSDSNLVETNGNIKREKVSVIEIWCEKLNGDLKNIPPVKATEIRNILESLERWKRCSNNKGQSSFGREYGRQIAYTKILQ